MRVTFDQCDSTEEVVGLFNKVFDNQQQMEAKIVQNAQAIEALKPKEKPKEKTKSEPKVKPKAKPKVKPEPKKKGKSKMKPQGSASMRIVAILMLITALAGLGYTAYVPTDITSEIAANHDTLSIYLRDVLGNMASDAYLFNPRATAPQSVEGRMYYDSGTNSWIGYNGTSWQTFDVAGGVGLNGAYDFGGAGLGRTIAVTDSSVVMAATDVADNIALLITQADTDGNTQAMRITHAGAGATYISLDIDGQATGRDIEGTAAAWYVTGAGALTALTGDFTGAAGITLSNDETITNAANGSITFTDTGGNTLIFDMDDGATSILIDSGDVITLDWGTVDRFISMETITFDDAATAEITMTGTGTNNLTITQAGTGDESLILRSSGTPVDAIRIIASNAAGGIDIDAYNDIDILLTASTDAEDILITNSGAHNSSIILTAGGTGTDAIKLETTNAAGDILIDSGDVLTFTSVDYKMFDGAATELWRIDGTATGSYHTISFTDATANVVWTFPDGGAGTVGIMSTSLATNFVDIANSVTGGSSEIIFEGSDADTEETIIRATDPTADIVWLLPNGGADTLAFVGSTLETNYPEVINSVWFASNEIRFEGGTADAYESVIQSATITGGVVTWMLPDMAATDTLAIMGSTLATNAPEIADSVTGGTNQLIFEGSSADAYETILTVTNPTSADKTITFPNKTGQVMLSSAASALSAGATPTLTVGLSNIYTMTPTDDEDQTITFSGAGTSGDVITIVFTANTTNDEVITFHATLVSSTGTLTIGTTAARYYSITFISNGSHWYEVSRTGEQT